MEACGPNSNTLGLDDLVSLFLETENYLQLKYDLVLPGTLFIPSVAHNSL